MTLQKKILTVIISFIVLAALFVVIIEGNKSNSANSIPKSQENTDTKAESIIYKVKEHDGKIAVFCNDETQPLYVLDSPYIRDLPRADQELLKNGITADNNTKLLEILEDYDN